MSLWWVILSFKYWDISFVCMVSQKVVQQNLQDNVGRLDFWTSLGHPGYLGEVGPLWQKVGSPNIAHKILFGISLWFLVLSEDNAMLKVVD